MSPSESLGVFGPWVWLIDLDPWWAMLTSLFISPVAIKFILRPLVEGRILRRKDEFLAFHLDMFFAPALASSLELVRSLEDRVYLSHGHWFHWTLLGAAFAGGVAHFILERGMYSGKQLFSVTKVYHEFLASFLGYLFLLTITYGFVLAPWTFNLAVMRLVVLVSLGTWMWGLWYDAKHASDLDADGHDRYWYAHVEDSWPWQHKYRYLGAWWARYVADWREVPGRLRQLVARLTP